MRAKLSVALLALSLAGVAGCADLYVSPNAPAMDSADAANMVPLQASEVDWAAIPDSVSGLDSLNKGQLEQLNRFAELCGYDVGLNYDGSICVMNDIDSYMQQDVSAQMKAFHFGMSPMIRYDAGRTQEDLQRFLVRRDKMLSQ